jgi:hypothetical protein
MRILNEYLSTNDTNENEYLSTNDTNEREYFNKNPYLFVLIRIIR